ncbi:VWA domain-containing protein [bacterium CPR1]|nr:VWA domain-containing protein [bacterium CPR1]
MRFAEPQQLAWLALWAVLVGLFVWRESRKRGLLRRFAAHPMLARLACDDSPARAFTRLFLLSLAGALLIVALARPQWGLKLEKVERHGLEVVIAMDLSRSMNATDYQPDRLAVAKRELSVLMKELAGNKLGLVGFAGSALTFCPLTMDEGATGLFLEQMSENMMPVPGTAVGDAVRESLKLFSREHQGARVIILLTDGEDQGSDPLGAAREAAREGVEIYALGLGNPEGAVLTGVTSESGAPVVSKLDEKTLQGMAEATGGKYFRLDEGGNGTQDLLVALSQVEKKRIDSQMSRRYTERFQIFLGMGLALLLGEQMLRGRRRRMA